jgi:hypothetical protein
MFLEVALTFAAIAWGVNQTLNAASTWGWLVRDHKDAKGNKGVAAEALPAPADANVQPL